MVPEPAVETEDSERAIGGSERDLVCGSAEMEVFISSG